MLKILFSFLTLFCFISCGGDSGKLLPNDQTPNDSIGSVNDESAVIIDDLMETPEENETQDIDNIFKTGQIIEAGIALTFDDYFVADWFEIYNSIFSKYGAKATFFIFGSSQAVVNNISLLQQLQDAGNEIGWHTQTHANAYDYLKKNTVDDYIREEIIPMYDFEKRFNIVFRSFAFPYGTKTDLLVSKVLNYFKVVRLYERVPAKGILSKEKAYYSNRLIRIVDSVPIDHWADIEATIFKAMEQARQNKEVVILAGHDIGCGAGDAMYVTDCVLLEKILQEAVDTGMRFYTISELPLIAPLGEDESATQIKSDLIN